jgi:hypothetical protein
LIVILPNPVPMVMELDPVVGLVMVAEVLPIEFVFVKPDVEVVPAKLLVEPRPLLNARPFVAVFVVDPGELKPRPFVKARPFVALFVDVVEPVNPRPFVKARPFVALFVDVPVPVKPRPFVKARPFVALFRAVFEPVKPRPLVNARPFVAVFVNVFGLLLTRPETVRPLVVAAKAEDEGEGEEKPRPLVNVRPLETDVAEVWGRLAVKEFVVDLPTLRMLLTTAVLRPVLMAAPEPNVVTPDAAAAVLGVPAGAATVPASRLMALATGV